MKKYLLLSLVIISFTVLASNEENKNHATLEQAVKAYLITKWLYEEKAQGYIDAAVKHNPNNKETLEAIDLRLHEMNFKNFINAKSQRNSEVTDMINTFTANCLMNAHKSKALLDSCSDPAKFAQIGSVYEQNSKYDDLAWNNAINLIGETVLVAQDFKIKQTLKENGITMRDLMK